MEIAETCEGNMRLALHWGMCLATYPFFLDVALTTGRLLNMQEVVALTQIQRRIAESWGEHSTLRRALQRVTRNLIDWTVLQSADQPGYYRLAPKLALKEKPEIEAWLIEAYMLGSNIEIRPFNELVKSPVFFPFQFALSSADFEKISRFELIRQGLDEELIVSR